MGDPGVNLRVADAAPNGYAVDRATVRQKKTGLIHMFPRKTHPSVCKNNNTD